jgi:TonB-dependent receptor
MDYSLFRNKTDRVSRSYTFNPLSGYLPLPIDQLGGEVRAAWVWEDYIQGLGRYNFAGYGFSGTLDETQRSTVLNFEGNTDLGQLALKYKAGYSDGSVNTPKSFFGSIDGAITLSRDHLLPDIIQNTVNGQIISPYRPASDDPKILIGLNDAGFAFLNQRAGMDLSFASTSFGLSGNQRYTASGSARYDFDSKILEYVEAGGFWEQSTSRTKSGGNVSYSPAQFGLPLSSYGFDDWELDLSRIGASNGVEILTEKSVRDFISNLNGNPLLLGFSQSDEGIYKKIRTREDNFASYVQAKINVGKLDIIGGLRAEWVNTTSTSIRNDIIYDENNVFDPVFALNSARLENNKGSNLDILPRVMINYRLSPNFVFRFGYYGTVARPDISQLNAGSSRVVLNLFRNPATGSLPTLSLYSGNPNLKASTTHNFDASLEYYDDDIGAIKIGMFYKPTKNAFFLSATRLSSDLGDVELPNDPRFQNLPSDIITQRLVPENSEYAAKAWGFEVSIEKRLKFLPGILSGLGVYANYTYSDSSRKIEGLYNFFNQTLYDLDDIPYATQPNQSGTFGLTYERGGLDASVFYTAQSRYLVSAQNFGRASYVGSNSSLDARVAYTLKISGRDVQLTLAGSDLLKGTSSAGSRLQVPVGF